jgi:CheY-like chemotaxis protein
MKLAGPTIAVVEEEKKTALRDWVMKRTSARVLEATPGKLQSLSSEKIDLVVLDVEMPRSSGAEILKALEETSARPLRVIVLSPPTREVPSGMADTSLDLESWLNALLEQTAIAREPLPTSSYPPGDWNSVPVPEIARDLGVSRATLARILATTERNLARWVHGKTRPKGSHEAALQRLRCIHALLLRAFKKEVIPRYLREPNAGLGDRTPLMALLEQDFNPVEASLLQMLEGVYT